MCGGGGDARPPELSLIPQFPDGGVIAVTTAPGKAL